MVVDEARPTAASSSSGAALNAKIDELTQRRDELISAIATKEIEMRTLEMMESRMAVPQNRQATSDVLAEILAPVRPELLSLLRKEYRSLPQNQATRLAKATKPFSGSPAQPAKASIAPAFASLLREAPQSLHILVAGSPGTGRRSLLRALFARFPNTFDVIKAMTPNEYSLFDLDAGHAVLRIRAAIVDVTDDPSSEVAASFVKRQHQNRFENDIQAVFGFADEVVDSRVHACLFLLPPYGGRSQATSNVQTIARLARYCNVIPVIARSDGLAPDELASLKATYQRLFGELHAGVYSAIAAHPSVPFAVAAGEPGSPLTRSYAHGTFSVDDHSDLPLLRSVLLETHTAHLRSETHTSQYTKYRLAKRDRLLEHERKKFVSLTRPIMAVSLASS